MLKQRILTAIVLFIVLAGVLSAQSPWPFFLFMSVTCGIAGWEWTRTVLTHSKAWPIFLGLGIFTLTLVQAIAWVTLTSDYTHLVQFSALISVLMWLFVVAPALYQSQVSQPRGAILWSGFALVTLFATWGALAQLYRNFGVLYVVSLLVVIWVADIAAYFVGRALGRHKLAPEISPGKTREGALAGILGVVIWVLLSSNWTGTFGADLMRTWGLWGTIALSILLAVFSISGDLFESLLKRRAGIKDSSHLLPGHGGVYDRIDAVVAVVPLAYLLIGGFKF